MKKGFVLLVAAVLLLSCCTAVTPGATLPPGTALPSAAISPSLVSTANPDDSALAALLPDKAGFQWKYFGFAEYAMSMELKSMDRTSTGITYEAQGEVADMSGGAGKGDFSVKVLYTVASGALRQKLQGEKALDNVYPELDLIRTPLQKGAAWSQNATDSSGKQASLSCSITDIKTVNGRKVYCVTYKDTGSDYVETREITEGIGITSFSRLYKYDTGSDMIGYTLSQTDTAAPATDYKAWLPKLGQQYVFFGLAEYGHKGTLKMLSGNSSEDVYEYDGVYADGRGTDEKFVLQYHVDLSRGTVTEQVISNERGDAEVNSKLHNLVILKFPLKKGEQWSHQATLNGKKVTVQAVVTDYDEAKGIVKVKYTAKGAAGYYANTYIETRTFEKGYGITAFSNLMPGDIGISAADAKDQAKLAEALNQHMFGYTMNKTAGQ
jgi:hypothetical protein